jgi:hypothetical protein
VPLAHRTVDTQRCDARQNSNCQSRFDCETPDIDQFVIIGSRSPSQVSFRLRPGKQISAECQAAMGD